MTPRERYLKTLTFGQPDRIWYDFGHPRRSTVDAWFLQGLPRWPVSGDYNCPAEFNDFVGMDKGMGLPIQNNNFPVFEEKIIREDEHGRVWIDSEGITMHDAGKRLSTPGFRTRKYLAHPVTDEASWKRMRDERWDPLAPGRYPADWDARKKEFQERDRPLGAGFRGLFWKTRDWVGFETLCTWFYDKPKLVHEMMEHITAFATTLYERALADAQLDYVLINEDMCYKTACMISPTMFREFMLPRYKRIVRYFRDRGVPIVMVDSDGCIADLFPLWIEAGVNATVPIEIAANNDPVAYRKKYGKAVAFWGGIDKREIRSKERVYKEVMSKVPWLLEQGGYLPSVDHGVPPDVPLRGYVYMVELIKALAEGRPVPGPDVETELESKLGPIEQMWTPEMNMYYRDDEEGT